MTTLNLRQPLAWIILRSDDQPTQYKPFGSEKDARAFLRQMQTSYPGNQALMSMRIVPLFMEVTE